MITTLEKKPTGRLKTPTRSSINCDDVDVQVLDALSEHSSGSMCIGSTTGEIHGLSGRLAAIRENGGISMCFWGGFVK